MAARRAAAAFPYPAHIPSWHIGHMRAALKTMHASLNNVDLIIEARDARLPLTSINPTFESLLRSSRHALGAARLIVYNKRDLADRTLEKPLTQAFAHHGQAVIFTEVREDRDMRDLLSQAIALAMPAAQARLWGVDPILGATVQRVARSGAPGTSTKRGARPPGRVPDGVRIMMCGMPNVGKSSLLNGLRRVGVRKAKAASEAPMPGHTRSVADVVRVAEPSSASSGLPIYVTDTPGIMVPYLGAGDAAAERALKLALTAGMKESLFDSFDLASYLLHRLLLRPPSPSTPPIGSVLCLPPSTQLPSPEAPIHDLTLSILAATAARLGAVGKGGVADHEAATVWLLKLFRAGRFGGMTLDDLALDPPSCRREDPAAGPGAPPGNLREPSGGITELSAAPPEGGGGLTALEELRYEQVRAAVAAHLSRLGGEPPTSKSQAKVEAKRKVLLRRAARAEPRRFNR